MASSIQGAVMKTLLKRDQRQNIDKGFVTEKTGGLGTTPVNFVTAHHTTHEPGGTDEIVGVGGSSESDFGPV